MRDNKFKKFLLILICFFLSFGISYGNRDKDRDGDNDTQRSMPTPQCRAIVAMYPSYPNQYKITLKNHNTYDPICNYEARRKYPSGIIYRSNDSQAKIESGNGVNCVTRNGFSECSATCGDFTAEQDGIVKITRDLFFVLDKKFLFGGFDFHKNDIRLPIKLELVMSLENVIGITEANSLFEGTFSKEYTYHTNCHVSCFNITKPGVIGYRLDGSPIIGPVPTGEQVQNITHCTTPILNPVLPTPTIKVGKIPPEIKVKIKDDNCVQDGEGYSCYASEGFNFELEVVKQGNPSPVDSVKSYVLNFQRNGCGDGGIAGECEAFESKTGGGEFRIDSKDFKKAGNYSIEFSGLVHDGGEVINISKVHYVDIKIVPNPDGLVGESVAESGGDAFANFEDFYKYDITIKDKYGNPIKSKKIVDLACTSDCIPDLSGKDGIHISDFDKNPNGEGGENMFRIVSAVPSTKGAKPIFDGKLKKWDQRYNDIEDEETGFKIETKATKTFKEPISYVGIEVEGGNLDVSKSQKYRIGLKNEGRLKDYRNGRVFHFNPENIVLTDSSSYEFEGNSFKEVNENFGSDINNGFGDVNTILSGTKLTFKAVIKALKDVAILEKARIEVRDLSISYNLLKNGKSYSIGYKLSTSGVLEGCKRVTTGLMVNGISQGSGKLSYTSEVNTFANSSKLDFKQAVRKNVANLTRNLTSGTKINSIYFVDLSKFANKDLKFSTIKSKLAKNDNLILKGGNLVIDTDVNDSIGIVVSADNFDVESNREIGNIYVTKNVKKINAFIYADGGFISGQGTGKARYTDEELRENKLDLQGSLFTSNTIGGSEKGENYCRLPGDRKTTDCELAKLYDLNYIRMHILCKKEDYSFKIEYNPSIQLNPPKVFIIR